MADEQTPQSDLIDDAIRQAERQLEAKLQALRMSALGETAAGEFEDGADADADADAHALQPAGRTARDEGSAASPASTVTWREAGGEDVSFAPLEGELGHDDEELFLPEQDASFDELPLELQPDEEPARQADPARQDDPARQTLSTPVNDLTPVREDREDAPSVNPVSRSSGTGDAGNRTPPARAQRQHSEGGADDGDDDDGRDGWRKPSGGRLWKSEAAPAAQETESPREFSVVSVPGPDELEFWAHTRTALRTLHQATETIPQDVSEQVSGEVQRIVGERIGPTDAKVRMVQQQLQQQLPRLQERLEQAISQATAAPTNGIRQIRDELPAQLDRTAQELRGVLREELEASTSQVHGAVQRDVAQLEQTIASNVTRMADGTTEAVGRVERDVDLLGRSVGRFERGVSGEFDRIQAQLEAAVERVEQAVHQEVAAPTESVRRLEEQLPAHLGQVERSVLEQLQSTQRELSSVMTTLVDANRAAIDRIAAVASTLDEDRLRRGDEAELIIDTVTTGWEGLANAMKALFAQQAQNGRQIAAIEERLSQVRDLEASIERTMTEFRDHVRDLSPAPVVVTVSHPEAEVRNSSRSGWLPSEGS